LVSRGLFDHYHHFRRKNLDFRITNADVATVLEAGKTRFRVSFLARSYEKCCGRLSGEQKTSDDLLESRKESILNCLLIENMGFMHKNGSGGVKCISGKSKVAMRIKSSSLFGKTNLRVEKTN